MDDTRKTVVLDRDLFGEAKDGTKFLIARKGERVAPSVARKHGILPIESASGTPVLESKVVGASERRVLSVPSNKRAY